MIQLSINVSIFIKHHRTFQHLFSLIFSNIAQEDLTTGAKKLGKEVRESLTARAKELGKEMREGAKESSGSKQSSELSLRC